MKKRIGTIQISINELETVENDPTIKKAKVIFLDFEPSGNKQCITEEVANEYKDTLIGKRICCKYISAENNDGLDALGSHQKTQTTDRNLEDVVYYMTDAIGFIDEVFIEEYNNKRVLSGYIKLWYDDHYKDIVDLLQEWLEKGISIKMSTEYLYTSYTVKDGIEYILDPVFVAHTILNSEERGDCMIIQPAYECSELISINEMKQQYNKVINSLQSINQKVEKNKLINNKEENNIMENIFLNALKANNQLSFGDIRDKLYSTLAEIMTAKEYNSVWISLYDTYENFFVYETYEEDKYVNYKVPYTINDNTVTINFEGKEKVEGQYTYVSANELENLKKSNNEKTELQSTLETKEKEIKSANEKIEELNGTIKSLNEKLVEKSTNSENEIEKFNELTEKLVSLNSRISQMQPIVDKYYEEAFQKALNEAKDSYKIKFESLNALDVFEEESTQNLIKESVNSDKTISDKAKYSLNSLIVENIKPIEKQINSDDIILNASKVSINEVQKSEDNENLVPIEEKDMFKEYGL